MKKNTNFDDWFKQVDKEVQSLCGISVNDLPDCMFRDWFDDGITPKRAAIRVIKNAKETYGVYNPTS